LQLLECTFNLAVSTLTQHRYDGDVTFQLSSGIDIKISNSQFILPDYTISSDGLLVGNTSVRDVVINSLQSVNANDMPVIGRQFFSGAYLMVNQDAQSYTLWQANPTTDTKLVAVGGSGCPTSSGSIASGSATSVSSGSSTQPTSSGEASSKPKPGASKTLSTGALAGIVIGAIIIAGLLVFLAVCLLSRKKRPRSTRVEISPPFTEKYGQVSEKSGDSAPQELAYWMDPQELDNGTTSPSMIFRSATLPRASSATSRYELA
jgi:hypothetical protein